jgi:hypothetical protein
MNFTAVVVPPLLIITMSDVEESKNKIEKNTTIANT